MNVTCKTLSNSVAIVEGMSGSSTGADLNEALKAQHGAFIRDQLDMTMGPDSELRSIKFVWQGSTIEDDDTLEKKGYKEGEVLFTLIGAKPKEFIKSQKHGARLTVALSACSVFL
jgi:hypothetical protein